MPDSPERPSSVGLMEGGGREEEEDPPQGQHVGGRPTDAPTFGGSIFLGGEPGGHGPFLWPGVDQPAGPV